MSLINNYEIGEINGNKNIVTIYVDSNGETKQEKKSIEEFLLLHPLVLEKDERIKTLNKNLLLFEENRELVGANILSMEKELIEIKQEKERLKGQLKLILKQFNEKNLNTSTKFHDRALRLFLEGDIVGTLLLLNDNDLEENEKRAADNLNQLSKVRILKARTLRLKNEVPQSVENYKKGIELSPNWGNTLELGNYLGSLYGQEDNAIYYTKLAVGLSSTDYEKGTSFSNLAVFLSYKDSEATLAENTFGKALKIRKDLADKNPDENLNNLASTLINLANFYTRQNKHGKAIDKYNEAQEVYYKFTKSKPKNITVNVAKLLAAKAGAYRGLGDSKSIEKSSKNYQSALKIFRDCEKINPNVHGPNVTKVLIDLAFLNVDLDLPCAEELIIEAVSKSRVLVNSNPVAYSELLIESIKVYVEILEKKGDVKNIKELKEEAIKTYTYLNKIKL